MKRKKFKQNQKIETSKGRFMCIAKNTHVAVFAPIKGTKVVYKNMFLLENDYVSDPENYDWCYTYMGEFEFKPL